MKRMLFLLPLILVLLLLAPTATAAEAACEGCTLGTWEGLPACLKGNQLHVCAHNFPDDNFRSYIEKHIDTSRNLVLTKQETFLKQLSIIGKHIASLEGIGYFPSLTIIEAGYNQLTELDLSNNPNIWKLCINNNQLTKLTGDLPKLVVLDCSNNNLTELNTSTWYYLSDFDCSNNLLTELNIHDCVCLKHLTCDGNQLKNLYLLQNRLYYVSCKNQVIILEPSDTAASWQCKLTDFLGEDAKNPLDVYTNIGTLELNTETSAVTLSNTATFTVVLPLAYEIMPGLTNPAMLEDYGCAYISFVIEFAHTHEYTEGDCVTYATCRLCGTQDPDDKIGHNFTDGQVCMTFPVCAVCGYKQPYGRITHICEETGTCTPRVCRRCGIADPDDHKHHHWHGVATCKTSRICVICYSEEGILVPHESSSAPEVLYEATWSKPGLKILRCALCGEIMEEITIPAQRDTPQAGQIAAQILARILYFSTFLVVVAVIAVIVIKNRFSGKNRKQT